jgi:hypothetical protein
MARMLAIVALLLGVGLTAYESYSEPYSESELRGEPVTQKMEGGSGFPTPPPY